MRNRIFSTDSPKAIKSQQYGWLNAIHYMAPASTAGVGNLCPHASAGCKALCLGEHSGNAAMFSSVRESRKAKARRFMRDRAAYMRDVVRAIELEVKHAADAGMRLCVRMNGSTDIAWEGIACERGGVRYRNVFEAFADIQFVDYTKLASRFNRPLPANYHLTFSRSETNEATALQLLERGVNVAVVFARKKIGEFVNLSGRLYRFIDGDAHDLRHLDPKARFGHCGYVIALTPKGLPAKRDRSGFVVR